jgi:hypothetical protein
MHVRDGSLREIVDALPGIWQELRAVPGLCGHSLHLVTIPIRLAAGEHR